MTCGDVYRCTATSTKSSPLYTVSSTGKDLTVQFTDYLFSFVLFSTGWFSFDFLLLHCLLVLWAENKGVCKTQTLKTFVMHYLQF